MRLGTADGTRVSSRFSTRHPTHPRREVAFVLLCLHLLVYVTGLVAI
jgi:hypothetical protein